MRFVVRDLDFGDVLERAGEADLEVFGRMMIVAVLGEEFVGAWFCERGGVL